MNTTSSNWVSHTPNKIQPKEEEDDFISAIEPNPRSPSPPSAFEQFFLPVGSTDGITIVQAANRTKRNKIRTPSLAESLRTEDFSDAIDEYSIESESHDPIPSLYINDALGLAHPSITEDLDDEEFNMARKKNSKANPSKPAPGTPFPSEPLTEEEPTPHFNTVEHVYEGVKSVWTFGKGITVFKPFMGITESVAVKALELTTGVSSLESADEHIKGHLSGVDKDFIDPAILKVWSLVCPIVDKSEEVVNQIVGRFAKKQIFGEKVVLEKVNPEDLEPEVTTPISAVH
jgi:hypothetical protein